MFVIVGTKDNNTTQVYPVAVDINTAKEMLRCLATIATSSGKNNPFENVLFSLVPQATLDVILSGVNYYSAPINPAKYHDTLEAIVCDTVYTVLTGKPSELNKPAAVVESDDCQATGWDQ